MYVQGAHTSSIRLAVFPLTVWIGAGSLALPLAETVLSLLHTDPQSDSDDDIVLAPGAIEITMDAAGMRRQGV
jgi:hypothetical protein